MTGTPGQGVSLSVAPAAAGLTLTTRGGGGDPVLCSPHLGRAHSQPCPSRQSRSVPSSLPRERATRAHHRSLQGVCQSTSEGWRSTLWKPAPPGDQAPRLEMTPSHGGDTCRWGFLPTGAQEPPRGASLSGSGEQAPSRRGGLHGARLQQHPPEQPAASYREGLSASPRPCAPNKEAPPAAPAVGLGGSAEPTGPAAALRASCPRPCARLAAGQLLSGPLGQAP